MQVWLVDVEHMVIALEHTPIPTLSPYIFHQHFLK